ncbi:ABC-2 family transporter protein [Anaerocolumna aminovalerica]|jgi:ABC-2 type transport system permease protein|uniref:ABC-2 type transport system permease protein n=1 Tax=Anaerocolumna aminovalerica TaxID=1527 RepID=A0A1I5I824_9FIRM|nr:ABC-2 family transporter protein [Anaerocolumna aminovalerica]MBU5332769.1 ABC-2 family transporter protein [Anaerocolumna aminovalerica]MDU6264837.1 ABC-2 family transporter protein [Anaerocolumna aminovalerica]SFO56256.1 ABC-2 type transport system permease protein [Anaerocolumna aminovalerica]
MKLYLRYFIIHLKSIMQYKTSFLLTALGQFLVSFNVFLGVYFMLHRFYRIKGFTFSEVLLCFSILLMGYTLAECFARGFDTFSSTISNGDFDRIMVRPRNVMLQVLGSKIEFTRVGRMLQAIVMFIYGIYKSQVDWNFNKIITVIFMIIGGAVLFTGIFIIYAAFCFFTIEGLEFMNIFIDGAREFGKYPVNIYGKRVLQIATFIVPYTLVQYYPLLYLLEKDAKDWYMFLPLLAVLFIIPCYLFWKVGIKHYKSTGS